MSAEQHARAPRARRKDPRNQSVLSCDLCGVFNLGRDALESHRNGKSHRQKFALARILGRYEDDPAADVAVALAAATPADTAPSGGGGGRGRKNEPVKTDDEVRAEDPAAARRRGEREVGRDLGYGAAAAARYGRAPSPDRFERVGARRASDPGVYGDREGERPPGRYGYGYGYGYASAPVAAVAAAADPRLHAPTATDPRPRQTPAADPRLPQAAPADPIFRQTPGTDSQPWQEAGSDPRLQQEAATDLRLRQLPATETRLLQQAPPLKYLPNASPHAGAEVEAAIEYGFRSADPRGSGAPPGEDADTLSLDPRRRALAMLPAVPERHLPPSEDAMEIDEVGGGSPRGDVQTHGPLSTPRPRGRSRFADAPSSPNPQAAAKVAAAGLSGLPDMPGPGLAQNAVVDSSPFQGQSNVPQQPLHSPMAAAPQQHVHDRCGELPPVAMAVHGYTREPTAVESSEALLGVNMTPELWRSYEATSVDSSPVDALAFKIVRDMMLSPHMNLRPRDVAALDQILAVVPATLDTEGGYTFDAASFPTCDLSDHFGKGGVANADLIAPLERINVTAMTALNPRFHAQAEDKNDGLEYMGSAALRSLDEIVNSSMYGTLCGRSDGLAYDLRWVSDGRRGLTNFPAGIPRLHRKLGQRHFQDGAVLRDPTWLALQNPLLRRILEARQREIDAESTP